MKRILGLLFAIQFGVLPLCACAAFVTPSEQSEPAPAAPAAVAEPSPAPVGYSYITSQELYALLQENEKSVLLIDIQPESYYSSCGHLQNAVSTKAYPANDDKLCSALDEVIDSADPFDTAVLIDMAGKAGVHNAYDYLAASGFDASKLRILKGGMMEWKYSDMLEIDPEPYEYRYISAKEIRSALRNEQKLTLIDFRDNAAYELLHIKGSVNVPVENAASFDSSLAKALPLISQDASSRIAIITAGGGEDAKGFYDYFARHSVYTSRLYILESGIDEWPESYSRYIVSPVPPDEKPKADITEEQTANPADEATLIPMEPPMQQDVVYYG